MLGALSLSNGYESIGIDTIDIISRISIYCDDLCKDARISGLSSILRLYLPELVTTTSSRRREPTDLPLAIGLGSASKVGRRIVQIELEGEILAAILLAQAVQVVGPGACGPFIWTCI